MEKKHIEFINKVIELKVTDWDKHKITTTNRNKICTNQIITYCPVCYQKKLDFQVIWNSEWIQGSVDIFCRLNISCENCYFAHSDCGSCVGYDEQDTFLIEKYRIELKKLLNMIVEMRRKAYTRDSICPVCCSDESMISYNYVDEVNKVNEVNEDDSGEKIGNGNQPTQLIQLDRKIDFICFLCGLTVKKVSDKCLKSINLFTKQIKFKDIYEYWDILISKT